MTAYYNEIDPYAAQWLRNLISAGHIAPGEVDERSIEDVRPEELAGFTQCHFFAGIGVWSLALRRAGWPDDKSVWTGSCPCQPFSAAGKGAGFADERHLWPAWFHLIDQCRPAIVLGEQVASKDGLGWLDLVSADMEGSGYAIGAADLCSAGIGAPHIRQRLWFVAQRLEHATGVGRDERRPEPGGRRASCGRGFDRVVHAVSTGLEGHARHGGDWHEPGRDGSVADGPVAETGGDRGLADLHSDGRVEMRRGQPKAWGDGPFGDCAVSGLADADSWQRQRIANSEGCERDGATAGWQQGDCKSESRCYDGRPGPVNGFWRDADWLHCRDGKWRPVRPGSFPLAHGATVRVGRLRAYGNAINAEAAKIFIESVMEYAP